MIHNSYKKVLILGSGALQIGQAGEFDYSGSQAIKALKEEGIKTILINPNIATIQTSPTLADEIYFLPVTEYFVEKVIQKEKPDGILLSFGGQTALNCGITLYEEGILKKYGVTILGTPISAIMLTEDRDAFARQLTTIGIPTPRSKAATSLKDAQKIAKDIGFPVMIRSGFSLGGQGSGIAKNMQDLKKIVAQAFSFVPQVLIEHYLHHYKEIEYEVVRDKDDNCITVCNMENMDPLGIHTGESIVVAPSQTLTNAEYHGLREASIKIVRSLGIVGECNVQFALNPNPSPQSSFVSQMQSSKRGTGVKGPTSAEQNKVERALVGRNERQDPQEIDVNLDYYVIEVNARLSRSSALASKATGYPLAYVAAKLALGYALTDLRNSVTQSTSACFEPSLDYIVVKIPRWDMEKFVGAENKIGSSMKSVGEVMGIGRTFEEAYQKAIRMLDLDYWGATTNGLFYEKNMLVDELKMPTPKRMFALARALKQKMSLKRIHSLTGIDFWFLHRIKNIVKHEVQLQKTSRLSPALLRNLKQLGFSDKHIGHLRGKTGLQIRELRKKYHILPSVMQIDTLGAEFPAKTNYLYMTYNATHHDTTPTGRDGVVVLGSGPYRIGSSVEFDWTSVSTVIALKKYSKKSIVINCNPETVSTDYDISDRLYFEELTFERIADIYEFENPEGIIVSVGGQTPNNRADALVDYGIHILGTSLKNIDRAEDRGKFSKTLDEIGVKQPAWKTLTGMKEMENFAQDVGYPVLVRPSYVLSGSAMNICYNSNDLRTYTQQAKGISKDYPVTISKFYEKAKEIEFDAVAQHGDIKAYVLSEHIENAGVHSGDATIVLPPQDVTEETKAKLISVGHQIADILTITGPFNIQFLAKEDEVLVIETNLRASRTFPFISKVTGVNMMELFVDCLYKEYVEKIKIKPIPFIAVKVAQFSFARLKGADPIMRVEMASTGEVACFGKTTEEAYLKGCISVGTRLPHKGIFVSLGGLEKKDKFVESIHELVKINLPIYATEKTAVFFRHHGIKVHKLYKIHEKKAPNIMQYFQNGKIDLVINIVDGFMKKEINDDATIRRHAIDNNIPLFTKIKNARLFIHAISQHPVDTLEIKSWKEYSK